AQIREILISESAWEEMTCLFAPSLILQPDAFALHCYGRPFTY
ncbi:curli production assembly/transport protein CsgE, partial [Klebsiella pneumoniae]